MWRLVDIVPLKFVYETGTCKGATKVAVGGAVRPDTGLKM